MTEGDINHIWITSWNIIWLDSWGCTWVLAYIFGLLNYFLWWPHSAPKRWDFSPSNKFKWNGLENEIKMTIHSLLLSGVHVDWFNWDSQIQSEMQKAQQSEAISNDPKHTSVVYKHHLKTKEDWCDCDCVMWLSWTLLHCLLTSSPTENVLGHLHAY